MWKLSGGCLAGVQLLSRRVSCLEGVWRVFMGCPNCNPVNQVKSIWIKSNKVRACQVKFGQVKSSYDKSSQDGIG